LQIVFDGGLVTVAVGFTVIEKVSGVPGQPGTPFMKVGVTVIRATTGSVPEFMATNDGIFPVPLAPSPMLVVLLVQV
jgi:hypothetical protein